MEIVDRSAMYFYSYLMLQCLFENVFVFDSYGPKFNADYRYGFQWQISSKTFMKCLYKKYVKGQIKSSKNALSNEHENCKCRLEGIYICTFKYSYVVNIA
jgi:hypothetical protein